MHDLKMAVVALDVCIKKVFWWNCSFATVAIFLNTIEFGESDLAGFSDRLTIVADFIDEILKFNAQAWDEERYFMSAQEVSTKWSALLVWKNVSRSAKTSSTVSRKKATTVRAPGRRKRNRNIPWVCASCSTRAPAPTQGTNTEPPGTRTMC